MSPASPSSRLMKKSYGYELLFRDGVENHFREVDPDSASRRTLDTSMQMGLELLCDSRRGFVNCTREVLLKDYMTLLPPTLAVVEVLESVPPDDLVVAALKRLKQAGYLIALDDFVLNDPREPLIEFSDIIKVDLRQTSPEQCVQMMTKYGSWLRHLLAEKVETREEFATAKKRPASHISRAISSDARRWCRARKFPPAVSTTCVCCAPCRSRNSIIANSKT